MLFRNKGQKSGIGGSSHITFSHPRDEVHQVFLNKGPEGSTETNREAIRVEAPNRFFDLSFRNGGFEPKSFLWADEGGNIRNHFFHESLRDLLLIIIQMFKESPYLYADSCLPLDDCTILSFEFSHSVPSLSVPALVLKKFCILISPFKP